MPYLNRFSAPTLSAIRRPNMDVDYAWKARAHTLIGVHSLLSQHHLEVVQLHVRLGQLTAKHEIGLGA